MQNKTSFNNLILLIPSSFVLTCYCCSTFHLFICYKSHDTMLYFVLNSFLPKTLNNQLFISEIQRRKNGHISFFMFLLSFCVSGFCRMLFLFLLNTSFECLFWCLLLVTHCLSFYSFESIFHIYFRSICSLDKT